MLLSSRRIEILRSFTRLPPLVRPISTLSGNPHIYVFPNNNSLGQSHILSLLSHEPPATDLAIGTTTTLPPTPESFSENHKFLDILQQVLHDYAFKDPSVISQAQAFASTAGSSLGSGGSLFPNQRQQRSRTKKAGAGGGGGTGGDGAGGASSQGGAGGAGRGGWVHLSDSRNPPDYGRIAWPEDIFGSLQVDGQGLIVGEKGEYQGSGTYRIVTREGILGLSDYLREKVVTRLEEELRKTDWK